MEHVYICYIQNVVIQVSYALVDEKKFLVPQNLYECDGSSFVHAEFLRQAIGTYCRICKIVKSSEKHQIKSYNNMKHQNIK